MKVTGEKRLHKPQIGLHRFRLPEAMAFSGEYVVFVRHTASAQRRDDGIRLRPRDDIVILALKEDDGVDQVIGSEQW